MKAAWRQLQSLGEEVQRQGDSVRERQKSWLLACLHRNRDTGYGRRFDFSSICTAETYQEQVPVTAYQDLAPWIERMAAGEPDLLFSGLPISFECTGGSSGGSKLIPYSKASLDDFQIAILPWLAETIANYDLQGSAYWAVSPAMRPPQQTLSGIPVGLPDAAYLGNAAIPAFLQTLAVPEWVGSLTDLHDWQLATLYWLIQREDLELISVWSPTFFLSLLTALEERAPELAEIFRLGRKIAGHGLPADQTGGERLKGYLASQNSGQLWPRLKVVSCWGDASSKHFFTGLKNNMPHAAFQPKGLLATEGVVTIPGRQGQPVLSAGSGFYEFLDERGRIHFASELEKGLRYEVVMTTSGGLYRYRTGDRVVCQGWTEGLPILRFIGRCGLVSDLVGEKLTDDFVARSLEDIPDFSMLVPSADGIPNYVLIRDACTDSLAKNLACSLETALAKNPQYAYARRTGQLGCLEMRTVAAPAEKFIQYRLKHGAELGDIKIPSLCPDPDILTAFQERTAETAA